jgi:hypothetical protein
MRELMRELIGQGLSLLAGVLLLGTWLTIFVWLAHYGRVEEEDFGPWTHCDQYQCDEEGYIKRPEEWQ